MSSESQIRRATSADAPAISALASRLFLLGCLETAAADMEAYISTELTVARFSALILDRRCEDRSCV